MLASTRICVLILAAIATASAAPSRRSANIADHGKPHHRHHRHKGWHFDIGIYRYRSANCSGCVHDDVDMIGGPAHDELVKSR